MQKVVSQSALQTRQEPSPQSTPQRKMYYDAWEQVTKTRCCNHWWKGDVCLYGGHKLR
jgi:hypothetical protein